MKIETIKSSFIAFDALVKAGQLRSSPELTKVHETVKETLRLITSEVDSSAIKVDSVSILSDVEELVWQNKSFWESPEAKTFLVALNELGVSSDQILIDTVLHLLETEEDAVTALEDFVDIFPECKTAQDAKGRNLASVAIETASLDSVLKLAKARFDFITPDKDGNTALHHLAMSDHFKEGDYQRNLLTIIPILAKVNSLDLQNAEGVTPLHLCILNCNNNLFHLFCHLNQDFALADAGGKTALHLYCMQDGSRESIDEAIETLVTVHKVDPNIADSDGNTALHLATKNGNFKSMHMLLKLGADPNLQNAKGETPLHILARTEASDSDIELLLSFTSRLDLKTDQDQTAIEVAIENKQWRNLVCFLALSPEIPDFSYKGKSLLDFAIENESPTLLSYLISVNKDLVLEKDDKGQNLLHRMLLKGSVELAKCCMVNRFTHLENDNEGQSFVDFAVQSGKPEVLHLLFELGVGKYLDHYPDVATKAFQKALEIKDMDMVCVFVVNGFCLPGAIVDDKPIAQYAYETKNWKLLNEFCKLMKGDVRFNFLECFGESIDEVVVDLAKNNCFETLNYMIYFGFVHFDNPKVSDAFVTEAARNKQWNLLGRYINKCFGCEQVVIDGDPLIVVALKESVDQVVAHLIRENLVDPFSEYEGKRLIDQIIEKKMVASLRSILPLLGNLTSLNVDPHNLYGLAVEVFENEQADPSSDPSSITNGEMLVLFMASTGIDFSAFKINGLPLLHYACKNFSIRCLTTLLRAKASVDQRDSMGRTALFHIIHRKHLKFKDHIEAFAALILAGAQIHVQEWDFSISRDRLMRLLGNCSNTYMRTCVDARLLMHLYGFKMPGYNEEFSLGLKAGAKTLRAEMPGLLRFYKEQNLSSTKEIPEIGYPGEPFAEIQVLRQSFAAIPDADLEGVLGIDEDVIPVDLQRINFELFLTSVEHAVHITGVNTDNPSLTYEPIRRSLKHLALQIDSLELAEKITVLTQFSRIIEGFCIDPYLKASNWVYGTLVSQKEGLSLDDSFEMGDPIVDLRRKLYVKMADWRDHSMRSILKEADGLIDTHARNWAYRYFGPEIGTSFDEDDLHLDGHGMQMLTRFLNSEENPDDLLKELRARFDNYFTSYAFQSMSRLLMLEVQEDEVTEQNPIPRCEIILDYFHNLIDLQKNDRMEKELVGADDELAGRQYIEMRAAIEPFQEAFDKERFNLSRLNSQLDIRKSISKSDDPKVEMRRAGSIKDLESRIKELNGPLIAAQEKLSEKQAELQLFIKANEYICERVDRVEGKAGHEHAAVAGEYVSYSEKSARTEISIRGCWEFFKLFTLYERTSV